ncbi:vesicle-associated membrane protein 72 [Marchantia polymorpha subsp. ruderalis]|nr:hypothetical protein MARPO_0008s0223 [Marchantia polymorpha]BAS01268.1 vesicle-associated membrane protein 72B [Marchantia polymorpha]BBN19356.1 hypothetical protein Mp_8g09990 [Marchantia polymorpha subsp. ruderalis]|eukprot:PTQ47477.1 hypothetical protein MARPO_0008s0223 [Marchantia polymorpha]
MGAKNGLIYCFVARGTGPGVVVLADYSPFEGNFNKIALECAQKLAANNHSITYTCDRHTFNFLVEDGITYLVVAEESFPRKIPFAFLARVKDDFRKKFGGEAGADMAVAHSLDKRFRPIMKEHMTFCLQHPEELDKVSKIQKQVDDVKGVMMLNIDKIIERHERLEVIEDKAGNLANEAQQFQKKTNTLKNNLWWQNMKVKLFVLLLIVVVILVIWLSICHGFSCSSGGGGGGNNPPANTGSGTAPPGGRRLL